MKLVSLSEFKKVTGVHITTDHEGKMSGMISLSTTCKCNDLCIKRICSAQESKELFNELKEKIRREYDRIKRQEDKKDPTKINRKIVEDAKSKLDYLLTSINSISVSICGFCFSDVQQDHYKNMKNPLMKNLEILTSEVLDTFPLLNVAFFRLESFGDLMNVMQAINYINFAYSNPHVTFTLWTKNPHFLKKAIEKVGKPENLIVIQSSQYLNKVEAPRYNFIDGVFTVYSKYYLMQHPEVKINCGALHCLSCLKCYKKHDGVFYINELLK